MANHSQTELIIEAGRTESQYWKDLWRYRELFYFLAWRDILVRYKQTVIVSPVGFSSSIVPEQWRSLYFLNPMVGVIDGFRWVILGGEAKHLLVRIYAVCGISGVVVC